MPKSERPQTRSIWPLYFIGFYLIQTSALAQQLVLAPPSGLEVLRTGLREIAIGWAPSMAM